MIMIEKIITTILCILSTFLICSILYIGWILW